METDMKPTHPYSLDPAPAHATLAAHAATITARAFGTSPRGLESLPVPMPLIGGKRQPLTRDIWAAAIATIDDEAVRLTALGRLPDDFAREVLALLPTAVETQAECRAA